MLLMAASVRTARSPDLPALVRLCRAAVGPHDYVLAYLSEMVAGREVRVVQDGGRIVAMGGITECADGALWLGQLRTHPLDRRRGHATRLLDDAFDRVVRERRPALRLWTSGHNKASQAVFDGNGFRRIATFTRMVAVAAVGGVMPLRPARGATRLWQQWRRSAGRRDGHGYVGYQWHFVRLTQPVLSLVARRNELFIRRNVACILWSEEGDPVLYGAVIAGGGNAPRFMRRAATALGRARVEVFLPRRGPLVRAARRAGYEPGDWGAAAILFERSNPAVR